MISVASLLKLPSSTTSKFGKEIEDDEPSHKIARLHADSDISQRRHVRHDDTTKQNTKIVRITVEGVTFPDKAVIERQIKDAQKTVKDGIRTILSDNHLYMNYEHIFDACRYLIIAERGHDLHHTIQQHCNNYARDLVSSLKDAKTQQPDEIEWLASFKDVCVKYHDKTCTLQAICVCLDELYVGKNAGIESIQALAYAAFVEFILSNMEIRKSLENSLSLWARWERENKAAHPQRDAVKAIMAHIGLLGQYHIYSDFYIDMTREQYAAKAKNYQNTKPQEFFDELHAQIQLEFQRSKDVLQASSFGAVREAAELASIQDKADWLAHGTISVLDKSNFNAAQLSSVYKLFVRVGTSEVLRAAFRKFVDEKVSTIVKDIPRQEEMVTRLLDFNQICQHALSNCFVDVDPASTRLVTNAKFKQAVEEGFRAGFLRRQNKPAEMIAKYLDKTMRKGQKGATDVVFHGLLDAALALYRFTNDKDVFRTFYHHRLAKRILTDRSASNDIEQEMLKKLKNDYDAEFSVGEDMFKDLALSRDMMLEWHATLPADDPAQKLNVRILQQSVWPFSPEQNSFSLPVKMQEQLTRFEETYYKKKHSARQLFWTHALGTAELRTRFKHGPKDLSLSLYQAVVMLLFNGEDSLSYEIIKASVCLEEKDLKPVLQSLACGKKKVLRKLPKGPEVNASDVFEFNNDFKDDKIKVHINSIQSKVTEEESKKTHSAIESDRKHIVSAAIVRVMKAKKRLKYERLKEEVIKAVSVHFKPDVDLIKRQIDWCVDNEYLERDEEDRNLFKYKA